jgi:esterase FrsA
LIATLAIDIPGVGNAPIKRSTDAERLYGAVLDWVPSRAELDAKRVGYWGGSMGGY